MFCNQCEQTAKGTGCTVAGVCGKNADIQSLQEILLYGLKGISAYAWAARKVGKVDPEVDAFMHEALYTTVTNVNFDLEDHINMALKCGQMNLKVMEMLDKAYVERYGAPTPVEVETGTKEGYGILVTGHDLPDLEELLKQTEGKGINVYTHSEMLPAHGYPELRKYEHLVGNYGGAWQDQVKEFAEFPGTILVTTNCVQIPKESYSDRLFTTGVASVNRENHIEGHDFSKLIEKTLQTKPLPEAPGKKIMTGFHHSAILGIADKVIDAVKSGKVKHFFLIGGCDGAKTGRNYYTEIAERIPQDCIILTLACGKYRFNKKDFGTIGDIPRLIDIGQCNNAYSAIQVAVALADAFKCGVNDLPLSLILSWFEQKAVAILLTLLSLDIKGMRLGPTPPAFVSENVFKVLQDKFDLKLITTPEEDLKDILAQ
ncbi:MAG: hydroxylamine reductase [Candidatus Schekmanbacteria bacterium]|nr:MAG: hydroxylamine reductase [Candidatus Schekmanbacteria bacterium]